MSRLIDADALEQTFWRWLAIKDYIEAERNIIRAAIVVCHDAPTVQPDAPSVMTLEEVISIGQEDVCGIVEILEEEHMYGCFARRYDEEHVELVCDVPNLPEKLQKGCARIWTARPTQEQREATPWE